MGGWWRGVIFGRGWRGGWNNSLILGGCVGLGLGFW